MPKYKIKTGLDISSDHIKSTHHSVAQTLSEEECSKVYEGYKKVIHTPLDVPKVDLDLDLLDWLWQKHGEPLFDKDDTLDSRYRMLYLYSSSNCNSWVKKEIPQILDALHELPFDKFDYVIFVSFPDHGLGPHFDLPNKSMLDKLRPWQPSQYRYRWTRVTEYTDEPFYLTKDRGQTKIYPMTPIHETNAFCYAGCSWEHGLEKGYSPNERTILMPVGDINMTKAEKLIDRSIIKYSDYVLYDNILNETSNGNT